MKINLWNAGLVPGEEEAKGEDQGLGQELVQERTSHPPRGGMPWWLLWELCKSLFQLHGEHKTSLKWCKAQQGHPVWAFPWRDAEILTEDSWSCSAGEEEWQILWAGAGREAQQESYSSSGSQDNQGPSCKAATGLFYQIHPFKCIPLKREYKYCPENKLPYRTLPLKISVFWWHDFKLDIFK